MRTLRLGTRGSELALWQAHEVRKLLLEIGILAEIEIIRTTGDKRAEVPLASIGGKGVFLKEIEEALDRGEIDLAVHSLKDVPSIVPERFALAAFLERADPRDAWIQRDRIPVAEMPAGAVVGTSSPRRRAQLLRRYPHLRVDEIRGNVDTRLKKVHQGLYAGAILAAAGLHRLGRESEATSFFGVDEIIPAAGQGIIVIETLANREDVIRDVEPLTHRSSALAARCERGVLQKFGTLLDCNSSIAVHATVDDGTISIAAFLSDASGANAIEARDADADAGALVERVYQKLKKEGAEELWEGQRPETAGQRPETAGQRPKARGQRPEAGGGSESQADPQPESNLISSSGLWPHSLASNGKVFLIGAGPGDPKLLTLRAAELLAAADVVVLDALVSPETAERIRPGAEIIDAGKRSSAHTLPQDEINQLLIDEARKGKRVVRLKGGDPFVFGRGGEEAEDLRRAGIDFEIVPGISSAIAGPAYAGIPVTHRAHATAVTLVTGHESDSSKGIDWPALARSRGTLVFLMGMANLEAIASRLVAEGMEAATPVAVIAHATTPRQKTVTGTLADIVARVRDAALPTPALIVVGSVVTLRESIEWFESRPLFGRTILVTRSRAQASALSERLRDAGAEVIEFPTIEIAPPESFDSLDRLIEGIDAYDWIVFTSANGVASFFERLRGKGRDARALVRARVAAVGGATAESLESHGIAADLVPETFQSDSLLPHFGARLEGVRFGVVRGEKGRDEWIAELRRRGASVDLAVAYQTKKGSSNADNDLQRIVREGKLDAVTFTSSSTVEGLFDALGEDDRRRLAARAALASIGPVTSETLRAYGAEPRIEARRATVADLAEALIEALAAPRND